MISKHTNFRTLLIAGALLLIGIAVFLNRTVSNIGMGRFAGWIVFAVCYLLYTASSITLMRRGRRYLENRHDPGG